VHLYDGPADSADIRPSEQLTCAHEHAPHQLAPRWADSGRGRLYAQFRADYSRIAWLSTSGQPLSPPRPPLSGDCPPYRSNRPQKLRCGGCAAEDPERVRVLYISCNASRRNSPQLAQSRELVEAAPSLRGRTGQDREARRLSPGDQIAGLEHAEELILRLNSDVLELAEKPAMGSCGRIAAEPVLWPLVGRPAGRSGVDLVDPR
jgi:hypothetical protein